VGSGKLLDGPPHPAGAKSLLPLAKRKRENQRNEEQKKRKENEKNHNIILK
jgi:hypothetical protein